MSAADVSAGVSGRDCSLRNLKQKQQLSPVSAVSDEVPGHIVILLFLM